MDRYSISVGQTIIFYQNGIPLYAGEVDVWKTHRHLTHEADVAVNVFAAWRWHDGMVERQWYDVCDNDHREIDSTEVEVSMAKNLC